MSHLVVSNAQSTAQWKMFDLPRNCLNVMVDIKVPAANSRFSSSVWNFLWYFSSILQYFLKTKCMTFLTLVMNF